MRVSIERESGRGHMDSDLTGPCGPLLRNSLRVSWQPPEGFEEGGGGID